jgi:uncharacterized protein YacL
VREARGCEVRVKLGGFTLLRPNTAAMSCWDFSMNIKWIRPISLVFLRITTFILLGIFCAWLDFLKDSHLDNTNTALFGKTVGYLVFFLPIGIFYSILKMNSVNAIFSIVISVFVVFISIILFRVFVVSPHSYSSTVTILSTKDYTSPMSAFYEKMYFLSLPISIGILLLMENLFSKIQKTS